MVLVKPSKRSMTYVLVIPKGGGVASVPVRPSKMAFVVAQGEGACVLVPMEEARPLSHKMALMQL